MSGQYSFSRNEAPPAPTAAAAVLALDTGSPVVSVAVSIAGEVVAEEATELQRSSGRLLEMIDRSLQAAGLAAGDLDLLIGLRGPGSFTGLRVGLATLQGMRLALGVPAATMTTLQVLATLAPEIGPRVTSCVDALRGEWIAQDFSSSPPHEPRSEPQLRTAPQIAAVPSRQLVGFGISRLREQLGVLEDVTLVEPGPLAPQALRQLDSCPLDRRPESLAQPLYLRPPAATPPRTNPASTTPVP